MNDQTLLYWGLVVTMFLVIAALITAREMVERHLESSDHGDDESAGKKSSAPE